MLTPYQERISFSKKIGVHEEERNISLGGQTGRPVLDGVVVTFRHGHHELESGLG